MKKLLIFLLSLSLFLTACNGGSGNAPAEPVPPTAKTDVQSPVESIVEKEPKLVLKEEKVEIIQGSTFDPVSLIESGNYDKISFSSIDTSVVGEKKLDITITKNGKMKEYTVVVNVIRPKTEISWEILTEGPVFLIHPDKLMGYEEEENYKSFYEYPVFTSNPPEVAQLMNQIIDEEHIWGIAETFSKMSNIISPGYDRSSPGYDRCDILQARTKVSEGKETIVVHTEYILTMYQTCYRGLSHIVSIFDKATGYPLSNQEQLARYGLDSNTLIERLETFIADQEYNTQKMGLKPFRPDMTAEEAWDYTSDIYSQLNTDDYAMVFLEKDIEITDLQGKLIFVEEGKLYCEFVVFENMIDSGISYLLLEVGPVE